jgi:hypothetical protein
VESDVDVGGKGVIILSCDSLLAKMDSLNNVPILKRVLSTGSTALVTKSGSLNMKFTHAKLGCTFDKFTHQLHEELISDQGRQFESIVAKARRKQLQCAQTRSTVQQVPVHSVNFLPASDHVVWRSGSQALAAPVNSYVFVSFFESNHSCSEEAVQAARLASKMLKLYSRGSVHS